jgi:hypothetical protein
MRLWTITLLLCTASTAAFGQAAEFSFGAGAMKIGGRDLGGGYSLDDGWRFQFRTTLNNWKFFGHEFGYGYNRTHLLLNEVDQGGMAIHQGFYNFLVYPVPEGGRVRPFITGGGQFSNFVPPGASAASGQGSTKFGVNYGGGVKVRVTERYMVRFDVRQYLTGKPFDDVLPTQGKMRVNEFSIGFAFTL